MRHRDCSGTHFGKYSTITLQVSTLSQPSKEKEEANAKTRSATRTVRKQAVFASDDAMLNPYSEVEFDPAKVENFSLRKSSKGAWNIPAVSIFY